MKAFYTRPKDGKANMYIITDNGEVFKHKEAMPNHGRTLAEQITIGQRALGHLNEGTLITYKDYWRKVTERQWRYAYDKAIWEETL